MINILIILLYAIGNQFEISLIGQMSISDIAVLLFFLYLPTNRKMVEKLLDDKDIIHIAILYLFLVIIQIASETILSNSFENSAKSIAVTILSLLKFIFLWLIVSRKDGNIKLLLLFSCIATILFKKTDIDATYSQIVEGEAAAYLKFYLAPLIGDILILITLFYKSKAQHSLFIVSGITIIILGARSMGLIIFFTGIITLVINKQRKISKLSMIIWGVSLSFCCYILYVIYVDAVLSGAIISGNSSHQFKQLNNPYNPIEALFMGRSENVASLAAISDSPWFGWGSWTNDVEYKYHIMIARSKGLVFDKNNVGHKIIPSHSVILGYGVNNGFIALILSALIICFFCKKGINSINNNNPYKYLVTYSLLLLIWNSLFSPISHMRYDFPSYFVYCYYSYKWILLEKKKQLLKLKMLKSKKIK